MSVAGGDVWAHPEGALASAATSATTAEAGARCVMRPLYERAVPDAGLLPHLALFAVGVVAGALNVVAGGGSFLTLPALLFFGLPAAAANGTNRVGVLAQNLAGVWGFHRSSAMDWAMGTRGEPPGTGRCGHRRDVGPADDRSRLPPAVVGGHAGDDARDGVPVAGPGRRSAGRFALASPGTMIAFFLVGVYGGLILEAGVGFAVLAATSSAGIKPVRGNAVKLRRYCC